MPTFIYKPSGPFMIQYNGSNLTDLQNAFPDFEFIVDGDALTLNDQTVNVTDWVLRLGGPLCLTNDSVNEQYQLLPANAEYAFTTDLEAFSIPVRQTKTIAVPALTLLSTQTLTVTWDTAMSNNDYDIAITPIASATVLGQLDWSLVSQSATGCVIAVKALLAITVGTISLKVVATKP